MTEINHEMHCQLAAKHTIDNVYSVTTRFRTRDELHIEFYISCVPRPFSREASFEQDGDSRSVIVVVKGRRVSNECVDSM